MPSHPFADCVGYMGDWIGRPCILRKGGIVQINPTGINVKCDIFKNSTKLAGTLVDLGLMFPGKPDDLRVTSTLKIENSVLPPAVFIVSNEPPSRICRQGCFSRS